MDRYRGFLSCLLLSLLLPSGAHAGQQKIVLKDHLKRRWNDEVVNYTFSFGEGQYVKGSAFAISY